MLQTGGMAEWFKAAVLKTASQKWDVGSNPTPSAAEEFGFIFRRDGRVGRRRSPAKRVLRDKRSRGFESLSLRSTRKRNGGVTLPVFRDDYSPEKVFLQELVLAPKLPINSVGFGLRSGVRF